MMTRLSYIGECSMLWEWSAHSMGCIVQVIIISLVQGWSSQRKCKNWENGGWVSVSKNISAALLQLVLQWSRLGMLKVLKSRAESWVRKNVKDLMDFFFGGGKEQTPILEFWLHYGLCMTVPWQSRLTQASGVVIVLSVMMEGFSRRKKSPSSTSIISIF